MLELFAARPADLDGAPGRAGEPRGLDGDLSGVLAAEGAAGGRCDDSHLILVEAELGGELLPDREWPLSPCPHGQPVTVPLCERNAGLERYVGDVGRGVGVFDPNGCAGEPVLDIAFCLVERFLPAAGLCRMRSEVVDQLLLIRLGSADPFGLDQVEGPLHAHRIRGDHSDEALFADDVAAVHTLGVRRVGSGETGSDRRWLDSPSGDRAQAGEVGRKACRPGHERNRVGSAERPAGDTPRRGRCELDVGACDGDASLPLQELAVAHPPPVRAEDGAVGGLERKRFDAPERRSDAEEDAAGGGGGLREEWRGVRHRPAAEGAQVVWAKVGVAQDELHCVDRQPKLFCDQRGHGARVSLADVDLAAEPGHRSVRSQMQPRLAAGRPSRRRFGAPGDDDEAVPEAGEEIALGPQPGAPRLRGPLEVGARRGRARQALCSRPAPQLDGSAQRTDDARVRAAAAEIAVEARHDLGLRRVRVPLEQGDAAQDHAGGAVAALEGADLQERLLDRMQKAVGRDPFDRRDAPARRGACRNDTRPHGLAVEQDGAHAADPFAAPVLGAHETGVLAEKREQARAAVGGDRAEQAVHDDPEGAALGLIGADA